MPGSSPSADGLLVFPRKELNAGKKQDNDKKQTPVERKFSGEKNEQGYEGKSEPCQDADPQYTAPGAAVNIVTGGHGPYSQLKLTQVVGNEGKCRAAEHPTGMELEPDAEYGEQER